tara:strand:+ start:833 stop:1051 length:219 start_codon:yes stop_codon:yes gene_type:complete
MKKIIFIIIYLIFFSKYLSAEEVKNCNELKKMSAKYLKCKASGLKSINDKVGLDTENVREKKYIVDWFKKKK